MAHGVRHRVLRHRTVENRGSSELQRDCLRAFMAQSIGVRVRTLIDWNARSPRSGGRLTSASRSRVREIDSLLFHEPLSHDPLSSLPKS